MLRTANTIYLKKLLFINERKKSKHKFSNNQTRKKVQKIHNGNQPQSKHLKYHRKRTARTLVKNYWKYPKMKEDIEVEKTFATKDTYNSTNDTVDVSQQSAYVDDCLHPEYLVYTWVLSLIALATTLKLYFLIKTLLAVSMVAIYTLFILVFYPEVFTSAHSHR